MQSPCIHRKAGADLSRCWVPSVSVFTYIDHLQAFEHCACFADKQPAQVGHFCESLPSLRFLAKCRWMWWEMVHEPRQLCSGWHQYCPQTLPPYTSPWEHPGLISRPSPHGSVCDHWGYVPQQSHNHFFPASFFAGAIWAKPAQEQAKKLHLFTMKELILLSS